MLRAPTLSAINNRLLDQAMGIMSSDLAMIADTMSYLIKTTLEPFNQIQGA